MIELTSERETSVGWEFEVQIIESAGSLRPVRMALHYADYNLWSEGADPPAKVAEAVLSFVIQHDGLATLGERFDAATIRRRWPDADAVIPSLIGG